MLESVVAGHLKLVEHPLRARKSSAQVLFDTIFASTGLTFLAGTSHEELLGASSSRVETLDLPEMSAHLATLGVPEFATALHRAQDRFGAAAGLTAPPEDANVAERLAVLRDHIRRYVGKAMAWALDGDLEAAAVDRMLQSWADWESTPGSVAPPPEEPSSAVDVTGGPVPVPVPAGTSPLDHPFVDGTGST